jgi:hypothetical protein
VVLEGSAVAGRLVVVAQLLVPHDVKVEREKVNSGEPYCSIGAFTSQHHLVVKQKRDGY